MTPGMTEGDFKALCTSVYARMDELQVQYNDHGGVGDVAGIPLGPHRGPVAVVLGWWTAALALGWWAFGEHLRSGNLAPLCWTAGTLVVRSCAAHPTIG